MHDDAQLVGRRRFQRLAVTENGVAAVDSEMQFVATVASIADKLKAIKRERDAVNYGTGRDLVVLKASVVDAELEKLDLKAARRCAARRGWWCQRPMKPAGSRARLWRSIPEFVGLEVHRTVASIVGW